MTPDIIVINLDRDTDRMAHMRAELDRLQLSYRRFPALRGDCLPPDLARYFPFGVRLSPGEIGCYASHLAIMRQIASGALSSPMLVLEDDVGLPPDLALVLDQLTARLPPGWDIVRLSYHTKLVARRVATLAGRRHLVRYSRVPTTTGAYLISASGARKFLAERPRYLPVDHDLRRVWEWNLDTYGVSPPLVRHDVLATSSIDAHSPAGRAYLSRGNVSAGVSFARLRHGINDFGWWRWLAMCGLNVAARLTPHALRPAFVQWAGALLA